MYVIIKIKLPQIEAGQLSSILLHKCITATAFHVMYSEPTKLDTELRLVLLGTQYLIINDNDNDFIALTHPQ